MNRTNVFQDEELQACIRFHGHFCPGLAIGFKASKALLGTLGTDRAGDEELVAIVETDACSADAVQVMTGCTFGKGNFFYLDHGKHGFTLGSRKSGRAVRACLRPGDHLFNAGFVDLFEKMQSDTATHAEREDFLRLRDITGRHILDMESGTLFTIREISLQLPSKARIVHSGACSVCGEPVRSDYLVSLGGAMTCPSCRKPSDQTGPQ